MARLVSEEGHRASTIPLPTSAPAPTRSARLRLAAQEGAATLNWPSFQPARRWHFSVPGSGMPAVLQCTRSATTILGPRGEQLDSQVPAASVELDAAILDRIEEIVQPGVNLNPADTSYGEQAVKPPLRRRSTARFGRRHRAASCPGVGY